MGEAKRRKQTTEKTAESDIEVGQSPALFVIGCIVIVLALGFGVKEVLAEQLPVPDTPAVQQIEVEEEGKPGGIRAKVLGAYYERKADALAERESALESRAAELSKAEGALSEALNQLEDTKARYVDVLGCIKGVVFEQPD